jgi:hypothetical protein
MPRHPLYFAECRYGRLGNEFQATDRDDNSRDAIIRQIRSGGIDVLKVLEIDEDAGTCRDVTEELQAEAAQPREPRSHAELRQLLIDYQRDHRRDLLKHGAFGW